MKKRDIVIYILGVIALVGINCDTIPTKAEAPPTTRHEMIVELSREAAIP